jgi:hypothetical protein
MRIALLLLAWSCVGFAFAQEPKQKQEAKPTEGTFIVHEWGTFLSVQGSDGTTIGGMVESDEALPKFVAERGPEGWERAQTRNLRMMMSKMETPVTYFYTDRPRIVQFKASMPKGLLTHWYPTVNDMRPIWTKNEQLDPNEGSVIDWGSIRVEPIKSFNKERPMPKLPEVEEGNPWLAMRNTDSALVYLNSGRASPHPGIEAEKFLFYRGLGSFELPLHIQSSGKDPALQLRLQKSCCSDQLTGLFLVWVKDGRIRWAALQDKAMQASTAIDVERVLKEPVALDVGVPQVKEAMALKLTESGLYLKEAQAMVNHWERSYFRTDGLRALYILPRAQTDAHIPIKVEPKPTEMVRTMVGRVEIITPDTERYVLSALERLHGENQQLKTEAEKYLAGFGRFREAILRRVLQMNASADVKKTAEQMLSAQLTVSKK